MHETYLRLCEQNAGWENRAQFFAVASRLMRRILVDHARARAAAKRRRGLRMTLAEGLAASAPPEPDLLDLDAALDELATLDADQARLVELRYFGGLSIEETGRVLSMSHATVSREWMTAKSLAVSPAEGIGPHGRLSLFAVTDFDGARGLLPRHRGAGGAASESG